MDTNGKEDALQSDPDKIDIAKDDGSVNQVAVEIAHHPEPEIKGDELKHLGTMVNDGQVKKRV